MIQIQALPAFTDNYIWLLTDPEHRRCAIVDPGDAVPVRKWLDENQGYQLEHILLTHHHRDHTGGVVELRRLTGATVTGPANENIEGIDTYVREGDDATVLGQAFRVIAVPGHTLDHIAFYGLIDEQPVLFSGDTLFAAGCGRLFEGSPQQMHESLQKLNALPENTRVYCAHEYTLSNLRFAAAVEPQNHAIAARLRQVENDRASSRITVPSLLSLERETNPFLRAEVAAVRDQIKLQRNTRCGSELETFAALRAWKDEF
ncbi:hydroxyacylglutathione hydrolase [Pseudomonas matsuisoli]|uniref:Hydroxyacylglutathione hydrolase n=1 Tax=Pseudomonas matsuisoli TaxID=1515666 RepID=A0A917PR51_9PSED|nr:hydroxyacylglutathione hydrolase [Pseudomonas matsuisoli]GGJ88224.1 hydroxyacylglutathione hydrolase [Pseudomonas matsuisoli]